MIPRSKKLGKKTNQRMLRKQSWTSLQQKNETTTPTMMGGELTVVKMFPSDFANMQVKKRKTWLSLRI
jgi:ribosomal protein S8E